MTVEKTHTHTKRKLEGLELLIEQLYPQLQWFSRNLLIPDTTVELTDRASYRQDSILEELVMLLSTLDTARSVSRGIVAKHGSQGSGSGMVNTARC